MAERLSMAERGRQAMITQFKRFYASENARILELKAGKDYFRLFALFTAWLQRVADDSAPELTEKSRNVLLGKTLRDWDGWVTIVDRAAEEMVFETFRTYDSPILPPSPTGKVRSDVEQGVDEGEVGA